ncbi:sulfoacetaldehyde dehydrogenase SafD [Agaribacter flavus]|uniref:Aldehyde dehydrogenase family protein n=1 Tax=Agaribacter flavus TaxID=1902781 RepID=A0ABV7FS64_9ALTE
MNTTYKIYNPFDNELIDEFVYDTAQQVNEKVALLKQGRKTLRDIPAFKRSEILRRLAELLEEHAETLAELITRETGKTISDSRVEMNRAINAAIASAEEARQISGEVLDSDAYSPARGKLGIVCWKPLGTVLCITPFNFPINIAIHKLAPAIAGGNTVLFKPGPQNTASAQLLTRLCYEAGIPEACLQLCMPDIPDMPSLVAHPDISCINFTGGTATANAISSAAGYKKLLLELGGNDPLIVMPDADLNAAADAAINQRFATAGQRCTAAKRVFVHNEVFSAFRALLLEKTSKLKVGNPIEDDTFIGPVINQKAANEIQARIEDAIQHGAKLICGNQMDGCIVYPTILEDVPYTCDLIKEETFGPVIPLCKFTDIEEIVPIINSSAYGLQAGIFTQNLALSKYLYEELEVGTLAVNDGPGFRSEHFPFGGVKESGIGREGIKYAIREMSYLKTLVI